MTSNWDLATGYAGAAHVTSAMEGWRMTGLLGSGRRVLKTRNQLKATLVNANTVTLDTGDLMFDGRHVSCDLAVDVTIGNGTQGQKRVDVIAAHYHRDATTSIETIEPYVFRGTPSGGTAAVPTVPGDLITAGAVDAYYPLYRLSLDGLTVGQPVALFTTQDTLQDLGAALTAAKNDYLSRINSEASARQSAVNNLQSQVNARATSASVNSSVSNLQSQITSVKNTLNTVKKYSWKVPYSSSNIWLMRIGKMVFANGNVKFTASGENNYTTASEKFPVGYRPNQGNTPIQFHGGGVTFSVLLSNSTTNVVMIGNPNNAYATAQGAWLTDDAMPA